MLLRTQRKFFFQIQYIANLLRISLHLGTVVSTEDPKQKDIKNRLAKGRTTFHRLRLIWKSKQYSRNTK